MIKWDFLVKGKVVAIFSGTLLLVLFLLIPSLIGQDKKKEEKANEVKPPIKAKEPSTQIEIAAAIAPINKPKGTGPTFPGNDPAFLVLPKRLVRSKSANDLLTSEVVAMTEATLKYLADTQSPNGSWSDLQFKSNTGLTAACVMAFMSEGSRPRVGKYGKNIDKGLEFILNNVQGSGVIANEGVNPLGPMYEHVFSSMALIFSYGDMPWRPQLQDVLARAIQLLLKSQKIDGGWRFEIAREGYSDLSVTGNVLWLLRTSKKAGFTVSKESINKGVKYIVDCAYPDGTFRYRYFGLQAAPSLGGIGLVAVCNNGNLDHPLVNPARDRIEYDYRRYTVKDLMERRYYVYGCFYASVAMYCAGDEYWDPWFRKATQVFKAMQRKDGEMWDEYENTIYPTALAAIILQAPKGYLPIYER